MSKPVIVTCAITGSIHTPSMSPHLPVTPEEIAGQAIAAAQAGAAIIHLHARDPQTGMPSSDPELFRQILAMIAKETDAVLNISTGGQFAHESRRTPGGCSPSEARMCSLNMGSMNFGLFPMAERQTEWRHEWEPKFLEATRNIVFQNTFGDIEAILADLGARPRGSLRTRMLRRRPHPDGRVLPQARIAERADLPAVALGVLGGIDPAPSN